GLCPAGPGKQPALSCSAEANVASRRQESPSLQLAESIEPEPRLGGRPPGEYPPEAQSPPPSLRPDRWLRVVGQIRGSIKLLQATEWLDGPGRSRLEFPFPTRFRCSRSDEACRANPLRCATGPCSS